MATEWQNQIRDLASGLTLRSPLPLGAGSRAVAELGNNVLRISYDSPVDPGGAGKVYELRQRPRDTPGGFVWESERVELKNLALHYLHGFGIVGQLSRDLALDGIVLRAKPGSWRQTAGLADFIQLSGVAGKAQITNCLFDNPHDDPINIHGTYVQVEAVDRAGTDCDAEVHGAATRPASRSSTPAMSCGSSSAPPCFPTARKTTRWWP